MILLFILGMDFQPYLSSLDFLSQFSTALPVRKNPIGSGPQVMHSSPLNIFVGSPIKEDDENPDVDAQKTNHGRQESREHFKQVML